MTQEMSTSALGSVKGKSSAGSARWCGAEDGTHEMGQGAAQVGHGHVAIHVKAPQSGGTWGCGSGPSRGGRPCRGHHGTGGFLDSMVRT